jgi:photosystem II stability/assembly factor-like uncharacterized protein
MADVNNGIIVGDGGTVLTTTDGGQNWVQRTVVSNGFQSTYMLNAQRATVGGFNVIYQTVNGGQTWLQDANSTQMNPVWDIHIFEDNTAVCVGGNGNGSAFLRRQ